MARHLFDVTLRVQSPKASVTVYTDAACTQVADITTPGGAAIAGAVIAVGLDRHVAFRGPNGVRTLYVKPSTDPALVVTLESPGDGGLATDAELEDSQTAGAGSYPTVVKEVSGSYPARPAGAGTVLWVGPDDPGVLAVTGDVWMQG